MEKTLLGFGFGCLFAVLLSIIMPSDKQCTITITDFQGSKHTITGKAD